MTELWQLYDNQGHVLAGQGAGKDDVYGKALLHAASHVWIWRKNNQLVEILLQKRANDKRVWPGLYDISAAGHIDVGENEVQAAIRESEEEIGYTPDASRLDFIGTHRCFDVASDNSWTENEIRFLYLLELTEDIAFKLEDGEVESLEWKLATTIQQELADKISSAAYVPHGKAYFALLFEALQRVTKSSSRQ